ncbi:MAG: ion channel [Pseudomonadota bacterium]
MADDETEGDFHRWLRLLYTGRSQRAQRFRYGLILFDIATIFYFIVTAGLPFEPWMLYADIVVGVLIFADFSARLWLASDRWQYLRRIYVLADIVVLLAIVASPLLGQDLGTLRVLRGLRLLHSYHLLRDLRRESKFFRRNEDTVLAAVNLFVFVFVVTSVVFVLEFGGQAGPAQYIDALYFTVATLTTTGFGDITLSTWHGKLLSVFIMVFGVALFLRLVQSIFLPSKVKYRCPDCGLNRHERDAIHCKHCGAELAIETEGVS